MAITTGLNPKALRPSKPKKVRVPKAIKAKKPKSLAVNSRKKETPLDKLLKGE